METLTVGQKVWMRSGDQFKEATVTEITDYRTVVEPALVENEQRYAIHFSRNGKPGTIFENARQVGTFVYLGDHLGWREEDRRPLCTEFGPWELEESVKALSPVRGY